MKRLEYMILNKEQKKLLNLDFSKFTNVEVLCINPETGEFSVWGKKNKSAVPLKNYKDKALLEILEK